MRKMEILYESDDTFVELKALYPRLTFHFYSEKTLFFIQKSHLMLFWPSGAGASQ